MRVDLGQSAVVSQLRVQFQGGFAGRECELRAGGREGEGETELTLIQFHPSDDNSLQVSSDKCFCASTLYVAIKLLVIWGREGIFKPLRISQKWYIYPVCI